MPHRRTIQSWYANSDIKGDPGIQEKTVDRLKKIAEEYEAKYEKKMMCSLVFDEMNIRQQIKWSLHQLNYIGYANFAGDDENTVAKQVIAFVLNGIEVNFEFPFAYFFIDSINAIQRHKLLSDVIKTVTRCGVKITNITFDGLIANIAMCELLGANLNVFSNKFQTFFHNPLNNEKIYIILDPCHMEKLVRNTLADKKIFYDENNNKIEWRYIVDLYHHSCEKDFWPHKLSKKHIQYKGNEMNVRLAAQTFSKSVADALQFLMDQKVDKFEGAKPTINFIKGIDRIFDIFNSKRMQDANIFKRSLSADNKRLIFNFLQKFCTYFTMLSIDEEYIIKKATPTAKAIKKVKRVPLLRSRCKTAFRGFIIDSRSLLGMFEEYVENTHLLDNIFTYNLLQDVIEMMFGRIRACGGFNNNPNVEQFMGAYRKIQSNIKIDLSKKSNCRTFDLELPDNMFYSDIYFVSSKRAKIFMDENVYQMQKDVILKEMGFTDENDESDISDPIKISNVMSRLSHLDVSSDFMIQYIASTIERKIMTCNRFHCDTCRLVFTENEKTSCINTYLNWQPCKSTYDICKNSEKFFKLFEAHKSKPRFDFKVLYCLIFRSMNLNGMYSSSDFSCDPCHKYQFIKCVVGQYISIRASQVAQQVTLKRYDKMVRQKYNHLIINCGQ